MTTICTGSLRLRMACRHSRLQANSSSKTNKSRKRALLLSKGTTIRIRGKTTKTRVITIKTRGITTRISMGFSIMNSTASKTNRTKEFLTTTMPMSKNRLPLQLKNYSITKADKLDSKEAREDLLLRLGLELKITTAATMELMRVLILPGQ